MALDSLYPSFVRIYYQSAFGPHVATIPTRQWVSDGPGQPGHYEAWNLSAVDASDMVNAMIDAMLPQFLATTTITHFTIHNYPVIDNPPVVVWQEFVTGKVGTLVETGQAKAVQYTMSIRTADFGLLKLVYLDTPAQNVWGNVIGMSARDTDAFTEITANTNAWAGRDNSQPVVFSNITISLNKRLRRRYNMV